MLDHRCGGLLTLIYELLAKDIQSVEPRLSVRRICQPNSHDRREQSHHSIIHLACLEQSDADVRQRAMGKLRTYVWLLKHISGIQSDE